MRIKFLFMRTWVVCISFIIFCSSIAYSATWRQFGELPESPKFGRTDYFIEIESINIKGDVRSALLKSVFSKPQTYNEGKAYTDLLSFAHYNCSNRTQAISRIDVYSTNGELVGSEKQDIIYVPVPEGSLDEKIYQFVCNYKK